MTNSTKLTGTVQEAMAATGLSRSYLYLRMADGSLRTTTAGRRRLVVWSSLLELLDPERMVA